MEFKDILRIERKKRNLSQDDLAKAIGVTRQTIMKWEKGENYPDMINLTNLSKVFNMSIDNLINNATEDKYVYEPKDNTTHYNVLLLLALISFLIPHGIGVFIAVYVKKSIEPFQKNIKTICNISIILNFIRMFIALYTNIT